MTRARSLRHGVLPLRPRNGHQLRRRLLRLHARAHRGHRRRARRGRPAQYPRRRRLTSLSGLEALDIGPDSLFVNIGETFERLGLEEVRPPRARAQARRGGSRRPGPGRGRGANRRRQHGRSPHRLRRRDEDLPQYRGGRARPRPRARNDRLLGLPHDPRRSRLRPGQVRRQLDQPQGGRALPSSRRLARSPSTGLPSS